MTGGIADVGALSSKDVSEAKVRALQQLHNEKTRALMRSIDQLRRQVKQLKAQNKESHRTQLIKSLKSEKRDSELKVDVLKQRLCSVGDFSKEQVDEYVMKKTLGGPKRFRPKTREELAAELSAATKTIEKLKRKQRRATMASSNGDPVSKDTWRPATRAGSRGADPATARGASSVVATTGTFSASREAELLDQVDGLKRDIAALQQTIDGNSQTIRDLRGDARDHRTLEGKYRRVSEKYQRSKETIRKLQEQAIASTRKQEQLVVERQRTEAEKEILEQEIARQSETVSDQKLRHSKMINEYRMKEDSAIEVQDELKREIAMLKQSAFESTRGANLESASLSNVSAELEREREERKKTEARLRDLEDRLLKSESRGGDAELYLQEERARLDAAKVSTAERVEKMRCELDESRNREYESRMRASALQSKLENLALQSSAAGADASSQSKLAQALREELKLERAPKPVFDVATGMSPKAASPKPTDQVEVAVADNFALMRENDKMREELGSALAYNRGIELRLRSMSDERDDALAEYGNLAKYVAGLQAEFEVHLNRLRLEFMKLSRSGRLTPAEIDKGIMASLKDAASKTMKHLKSRLKSLESQAEFSQMRDAVFRACLEKLRFHAETLDARLRSLGYTPPPMPNLQVLARDITVSGSAASSSSGATTSSSSSSSSTSSSDDSSDDDFSDEEKSDGGGMLGEDDAESALRGVVGNHNFDPSDELEYPAYASRNDAVDGGGGYDDDAADAYEDDESQIRNTSSLASLDRDIGRKKYYVP